jgi:hypothetical protein
MMRANGSSSAEMFHENAGRVGTNGSIFAIRANGVRHRHRRAARPTHHLSCTNNNSPSYTTPVEFCVDNLPALWETVTSSPGVTQGHDRPVETVETGRRAVVPSNLGKPQTIHNPQGLLLPLYLST